MRMYFFDVVRTAFKLPANEKLDGDVECMLWAPYSKTYVWGRLYLSANFICYTSRVNSFKAIVSWSILVSV